jgi:hypothetical protein
LRSDNAKWAEAYCKLLPQSQEEWQTLVSVATPPRKCKLSVGPMESGDGSLTRKTQQAALHHLLDQLPGWESVLMQHVNATISGGLGRQLDVLPPSLHTAACNHHVELVQSGRRQLKLDIFFASTWHAAAAVLTHMQGLDSLKLSVCGPCSLCHLSSLTALQHLNLNWGRDLTDSCIAHLSGLTALQHFDLSWCRSLTDRSITQLSSLIVLQHLARP